MVARIKSFENSLQNVLAEEETENQSYLKTLLSRRDFPLYIICKKTLLTRSMTKPIPKDFGSYYDSLTWALTLCEPLRHQNTMFNDIRP